jgi:putative oxidoreductase
MNKLFSPAPFALPQFLFVLRITIAFFSIYHGWEVFDKKQMLSYTEWKEFGGANWLPYLGKASELVGGILLLAGLFTRPACLLLMGTFAYITFFVAKGRIWYTDQPPFMFVLFALLFFFAGAGKWSIDYYLFGKKTNN